MGHNLPEELWPDIIDRIAAVSGTDPQQATARPDFAAPTPLHPQERLRLETPGGSPTARIIDLVTPIGKGQRGLIVSPPKAGKTMVLQAIAAAVAANHPEVHLMVVLAGERPEEVTDLPPASIRRLRAPLLHVQSHPVIEPRWLAFWSEVSLTHVTVTISCRRSAQIPVSQVAFCSRARNSSR
jgi:hypothetical protein